MANAVDRIDFNFENYGTELSKEQRLKLNKSIMNFILTCAQIEAKKPTPLKVDMRRAQKKLYAMFKESKRIEIWEDICRVILLTINWEKSVSEENSRAFPYIKLLIAEGCLTDYEMLTKVMSAFIWYGGMKFI